MSAGSGARVTVADVSSAGVCAAGLRRFCQEHNIDLRRLIRHGIPVSEVERLEDPFLSLVLQKVQERG